MKYAQINNDKVTTVMETPARFVEIETIDYRLLGCTYDSETGTFTGHKITLALDKQYILADGADTVRVSATIKTWDDQDALSTFTAPILFVVDGTPKLVTKKAAGYYVDYKSTAAGTKQIATQDDKFISQNSVSILAVEVEEEPIV